MKDPVSTGGSDGGDHDCRPSPTVNLAKAKPLIRDDYDTPTLAELAPIIERKPDVTRLWESACENLEKDSEPRNLCFRPQATFTSR